MSPPCWTQIYLCRTHADVSEVSLLIVHLRIFRSEVCWSIRELEGSPCLHNILVPLPQSDYKLFLRRVNIYLHSLGANCLAFLDAHVMNNSSSCRFLSLCNSHLFLSSGHLGYLKFTHTHTHTHTHYRQHPEQGLTYGIHLPLISSFSGVGWEQYSKPLHKVLWGKRFQTATAFKSLTI